MSFIIYIKSVQSSSKIEEQKNLAFLERFLNLNFPT